MNYAGLLQRLNVNIEPLDKKNEHYKTINSMIENGKQLEQDYTVECVDIFNATRPSDNNKHFNNENGYKQSLLWYGCFNSSVASKLVNGISPQFNTYTNYKSISCWDNIIGCVDNIGMSKFYKDRHSGKYQPNLGILMIVETNYKEIKVPTLIKIDTQKSQDYTKNVLEYNEDDDTEDEKEEEDKDCVILKTTPATTTSGNKFVYCKEVSDQIDRDQILQLTGELSPNPENATTSRKTNLSIPTGLPIPSTKVISGSGWLNGYLKCWDKYNHFLIPSNSMIKLKYLVIVKTTPSNKLIKRLSMSPSKLAINNNNDSSSNDSGFKNNIWGNVLTKKRPLEVIDLEENEKDDNNNNSTESFKKNKI